MFNKASYQNKLFSVYSFFIFIVIALLIVVFYSYIYRVIINNSSETMKQVIEKTSSQIDSVVKSMDSLSLQVMSSKDLQDVMSGIQNWQEPYNYFNADTESAKAVRYILSSINSPLVIAGRIGVFNMAGCFISTGKFGEASYALKNNLVQYSFLSKLESETDKKIILPPHPDFWLDDNPVPTVISLIRPLTSLYTSSSDIIGYVEIQQSAAMIEEICKNSIPARFDAIVYDSEGTLIYPVGKYSADTLTFYTGLKEVNGTLIERPIDKVEEFIYTDYSEYSKWTIVLSQQKKDFMAPVILLRNVIVSVGIIFMLITLLIFYIINRSLTAPVREMRKILKGLSLDNLSIDLGSQTSNNEITLLNTAFNKTLSRLRESIDQTLQARASEAHAHILAYQAQMNPHFLFNTLMAINGIAKENGNEKIMLMCTQLSNMLRYTSSYKNEKVTLENELTHTIHYLKLLKVRYEDFLDYKIEVAEDLYPIAVPKLIIQPIVENCFSHGFRTSAPPYRISITGSIKEGGWILQIADNGCGFDENAIKNIFARLEQYKSNSLTGVIFDKLEIGGMGLVNIYVRLLVMYGEKTVFEVKNLPEGGSVVTIGGSI